MMKAVLVQVASRPAGEVTPVTACPIGSLAQAMTPSGRVSIPVGSRYGAGHPAAGSLSWTTVMRFAQPAAAAARAPVGVRSSKTNLPLWAWSARRVPSARGVSPIRWPARGCAGAPASSPAGVRS